MPTLQYKQKMQVTSVTTYDLELPTSKRLTSQRNYFIAKKQENYQEKKPYVFQNQRVQFGKGWQYFLFNVKCISTVNGSCHKSFCNICKMANC